MHSSASVARFCAPGLPWVLPSCGRPILAAALGGGRDLAAAFALFQERVRLLLRHPSRHFELPEQGAIAGQLAKIVHERTIGQFADEGLQGAGTIVRLGRVP